MNIQAMLGAMKIYVNVYIIYTKCTWMSCPRFTYVTCINNSGMENHNYTCTSIQYCITYSQMYEYRTNTNPIHLDEKLFIEIRNVPIKM